VAVLRAFAQQGIEQPEEQGAVVRDEARLHADLAFQAQVAEPARLRRQTRGADLRAPGHGPRPAVGHHRGVLLQRAGVAGKGESLVRRKLQGNGRAIRLYGQANPFHVRLPVARQQLEAQRRSRREVAALLEQLHAGDHAAVGLGHRVAQRGDHHGVVLGAGLRVSRAAQKEQGDE
jgi:hypothetical protein